MNQLQLIVGLGNPGSRYADTRHNAGVWLIDSLTERFGGTFKPTANFFGRTATTVIAGHEIRLLLPDTYMNESGKSVAALAGFYRIPAANIVIAHDEIDFPIGKVRFKEGGGLAGHSRFCSHRCDRAQQHRRNGDPR